MGPSLTDIPPEIHGLIGRYLYNRDLISVSRTCKTLKDAFLTSLYRDVVVRAPIQWSRLTSLENLISSTGSGLKLCKFFSIAPQRQPSEDDNQRREDGRTAQEIGQESTSSFCLPDASASKVLNTLIRLLVMRIPENQLKAFYHSHNCPLEVSTLALLSKHQSAALRELSITGYSEMPNVSGSLFEDLQLLAIFDLDIEQNWEWPCRLILHNRKTLKNLRLGILNTIARREAPDRTLHRLLTSSALQAKGALPPSELEMGTLTLKYLGLNGLNIADVVGGALGFKIDIRTLTNLTLESCSGLVEAFAVLMGTNGIQSTTLGALQLRSFFIRHEEGSTAFAQDLTLFLTSFTGLRNLGLLIQTQDWAMPKRPILEIHGKTIQTLVWDERSRPRKDTKTDTSLFPNKDNIHLRLISNTCRHLRALSVPIHWDSLPLTHATTADPTSLERIFLRLPKLRTLHLRNLPEIDLTAKFLPTEYFVKGLASTILGLYVDCKPSNRKKPLVTIAIGAPLYRDLQIGSNRFPGDLVRDYLQLRVYHVDLNHQSILGTSPTVTRVAKGTAHDAVTCLDKTMLHRYWLT